MIHIRCRHWLRRWQKSQRKGRKQSYWWRRGWLLSLHRCRLWR